MESLSLNNPYGSTITFANVFVYPLIDTLIRFINFLSVKQSLALN